MNFERALLGYARKQVDDYICTQQELLRKTEQEIKRLERKIRRLEYDKEDLEVQLSIYMEVCRGNAGKEPLARKRDASGG